MPKDIVIGGVYVTPFVGLYVVAFVAFLILRLLIVRADLERLFWHPELAETGLFVAILAIAARLV